MATNSYNINVDTSQAQRAINDLNKSLGQLEKTGNAVSTALGAVFTAATASQFTQIADAATNLQNKLRLVAQEGQSSIEVFNLMAQSALRLGAPIEDVGNLFFRIANNTKDLGLKQSEQLRITELLTKSFMANGLSAGEASSAVLQFGQALGRGVLQGDELNSILENAPPIAQAIADKFGVTTGALRELGSQGKITSKDIIDAMMAAGDSIDRDFASRIPTIENAMSRFGTTIEVVTQQFDKNTGASKIIAYAITEVAIAVVKVSRFFEQWGGVIASVTATIAALIIPFKILGPIFAVVEAGLLGIGKKMSTVGAVAAEFTSVFDKMKVYFIGFLDAIFPKFEKVSTMIVAFLSSIAGFFGLNEVFSSIGDAFKKASEGGDIFARQQRELEQLLGVDAVKASEKAKEATKGLSAEQLKAGDIISKSLVDLRNAYKDFGSSFQQDTAGIGLGEEATNRLQLQADAAQKYSDQVRKIQEEMAKLRLTGSEQEKKAITDLTSAYNDQIGSIERLVSAREIEVAANNLNQYSLQQQIDLNKQLSSIQNEISKVGLTELEQKYRDIDAAARASAQAAIEAEQARRGGTPLPLEEQSRYFEEAVRGTELLKQKTQELTAATEAYTQSVNFQNFATKERIGYENELQKIQDDIAKSTMTEIEKKYYDIEAAAKASAKAAIEAEEARRRQPMPIEEQKKYYDEARKGNEELKRQANEQYQASRTFEAGWNKAFKAYAENATNAATQAERIFQSVTKNMEDMIVNFVKTGKFEWKSFVESILETILRSQIQQMIAQIFSIGNMNNNMANTGAMTGGFDWSSMFSGLGGLLGFAKGGQIPTNGPVLVGERGPEIITGALGRTVDATPSLGNVTYNINAVDAMSFKQMIARDPSFLYAVTMQGAKTVPGRV